MPKCLIGHIQNVMKREREMNEKNREKISTKNLSTVRLPRPRRRSVARSARPVMEEVVQTIQLLLLRWWNIRRLASSFRRFGRFARCRITRGVRPVLTVPTFRFQLYCCEKRSKAIINTHPNEKRGKTRSRTGQRICHCNATLFVFCRPTCKGTRDVFPERRSCIFQHTIHARLLVRIRLEEVVQFRDPLLMHRTRCFTRDVVNDCDELVVWIRFCNWWWKIVASVRRGCSTVCCPSTRRALLK